MLDAVLDVFHVAKHHHCRGGHLCAMAITSSQPSLIALSGGAMRLRTSSTKISPPPPGMESPARPGACVPDQHLKRFVEYIAKVDKLARAEGVNVDLGNLARMCDSRSRYHCVQGW